MIFLARFRQRRKVRLVSKHFRYNLKV